jgi:hypothetical protein
VVNTAANTAAEAVKRGMAALSATMMALTPATSGMNLSVAGSGLTIHNSITLDGKATASSVQTRIVRETQLQSRGQL